MSFSSALKTFGKAFEKVFAVVDKAAIAAEPVVALAFPGFSSLYDVTVNLVTGAEAAAASAIAAGKSVTGAQKAATVIAALEPYALQEAARLGITKPTPAQLQAWIDSVVAGLNAFGSASPAPVFPVSEGTKA